MAATAMATATAQATTLLHQLHPERLRPNKVLQMAGVTVGFGKRLNWPDDWFTLTTELSYNFYYLKNWEYLYYMNNGTSNALVLGLTLARTPSTIRFTRAAVRRFHLTSLSRLPPRFSAVRRTGRNSTTRIPPHRRRSCISGLNTGNSNSSRAHILRSPIPTVNGLSCS